MTITRTLTYAASTLVCTTALSAAQSGAMDKKEMMNHPVTVTGCVAAGTMAGDFMLTQAMPADSKMMGKETMEQDKMAAEHIMSFALKGGTDLKAHLGHKIEVTGATDKPMGDMKPMTDMKPMKGMDPKAKPMVLTVTSVKMISATCPQ